MSVVGVEALRGFRELVDDLGGDPGKLLARSHIRAGALNDPKNFVPLASAIDLLEYAARALRCPDFGLRLPGRQDVGILGPLAAPVSSERSVAALEIDAADLQLPIPSSHRALRELAESYLESHFGAQELDAVAVATSPPRWHCTRGPYNGGCAPTT